MENIFDLRSIREELDTEEWQDNYDGTETRQVFVGTVFGLLPSGKYYMPFACSNVDPCPCCNGVGVLPGHPRARVRKRNKSIYEKMCELGAKRGREYSIRKFRARNSAHKRWEVTCSICEGMGSKEANDDEKWYEQAGRELNAINCGLISGEGDPCDLFAAEYRDKEDEGNQE